MNIYYIYAYIRQSDGTPYYIGKGKGKRAWKKHGKVPVPTDNNRIVMMETNLTEIGALALERRMIRWWGRKDLGTGILLNMTDGGDGVTGFVNRTFTPETRAKLSEAARKRTYSIETRLKMSNNRRGKKRPHTEETKEKLRKAFTGRKHSEKAKDKMRAAYQARIGH